jgi:hypothetical protein
MIDLISVLLFSICLFVVIVLTTVLMCFAVRSKRSYHDYMTSLDNKD